MTVIRPHLAPQEHVLADKPHHFLGFLQLASFSAFSRLFRFGELELKLRYLLVKQLVLLHMLLDHLLVVLVHLH